MDEGISFFSFSLDQVIVENDANGINTFEYESLEQSNPDHTFYVVEADQFECTNQLQLSHTESTADVNSSTLEEARVNQIDFGGAVLDIQKENEIEDAEKHFNENVNYLNKNDDDNPVEIIEVGVAFIGTSDEGENSSDDLVNFLDTKLCGEVKDNLVKGTSVVKDFDENKKNSNYERKSNSLLSKWCGEQESRDKPDAHKCRECGMTFAVASRLKSHVLCVHMGLKKFKCDSCSAMFFKVSDLRKHTDTMHKGIKNYSCKICSKKFTDSSNLKRHVGMHEKEKPFMCPVCGKRYSQLSNLKRHRTQSTAAIHGSCAEKVQIYRCETCGLEFDKEALLSVHEKDHCDNASKMSDLGRNVDALIQNILKEETTESNEQNKRKTNSECASFVQNIEQESMDNNTESFEVKLINEIDRLESLKEADSINYQSDLFITNSNPNDSNYFNSCKVQNYNETDNIADNLKRKQKDDMIELQDECATIFESDVDLESSVNLAANLNQLIAENNVEFVSTEDDDTFIINLNSTIDAELLSDLLNIGIEVIETDTADKSESIPVQNVEVKEDKQKRPTVKLKKQPIVYRCKLCKKTFQRKTNYTSHLGIHDSALRKHKCIICKKKFAYQSTLNKHHKSAHTPAVSQCHPCDVCGETFKQRFLLKDHHEKVHQKLTRYHCSMCTKKFYKRSDFVFHLRLHEGQRHYKCSACNASYTHASHLAKHKRRCVAFKMRASEKN